MQVENPIAGQRCVHIHATLDTDLLLQGGFASDAQSKDIHHLSNMMVFHKPDTNSYENHTSFSARRHGSGMVTKAVVNLSKVNPAGLRFLGVTRDHMLDGDSAIQHPMSAGMFAVCVDGVVTIRAPCDDANDLVPGDFLYVDDSVTRQVDKDNKDIKTFRLMKARMTPDATMDPLTDARADANFKCETWTKFPIGRLVEMREINPNESEFRVNLCPFGAPYAMLDSGKSPMDLSTGATENFKADNSPVDGFALTWFDYGAIQPTKDQAGKPADQSIFGTYREQSDLGANQAMTGIVEAEEQQQQSTESSGQSLEAWKATHGLKMSQQAVNFVEEQANTGSSQKLSVFIQGNGEAQIIQNATHFREDVLPNLKGAPQIIQQGPTTVSVYVAGRKRGAGGAQSSASGSSSGKKKRSSGRT